MEFYTKRLVMMLILWRLLMSHTVKTQDSSSSSTTTTTTTLAPNTTTTTQQPTGPMLCNESYSMSLDPQAFAGSWYEVARNPAPSSNFLCAEVVLNLQSPLGEQLNIALTYSDTPQTPWINLTLQAFTIFNGSVPTLSGSIIQYYNFTTTLPAATFKLLETDYLNYALVCGYTNVADDDTSFGILLTRGAQMPSAILNEYISEASVNYANFIEDNMTLIYQNADCWSNNSNIFKSSITLLILSIFVLISFTNLLL